MEVSCVYITPKRKLRNQATSSSSEETSPEEKKLKHSYSPDSKNSDDEDQVMAALNLTETGPNFRKAQQPGLEDGEIEQCCQRFTRQSFLPRSRCCFN